LRVRFVEGAVDRRGLDAFDTDLWGVEVEPEGNAKIVRGLQNRVKLVGIIHAEVADVETCSERVADSQVIVWTMQKSTAYGQRRQRLELGSEVVLFTDVDRRQKDPRSIGSAKTK